MAKKPRANSGDKTVKIAIISFIVLIVAVGTALIINNRSVSYVATVNGQRISAQQYNYHFQEALMQYEQFFWQFEDPTPLLDLVREEAFESAVAHRLMVNEARDLGLVLSQEEEQEVREHSDNAWRDNRELIRSLGFSRNSFQEFSRESMLTVSLFSHLTEDIVFTDEELEETFAEFYEQIQNYPDNIDYYTVFVQHIEVETLELAEFIFSEIIQGGNFIELMQEHSINYDPDNMPETPDGTPIYFMDIFDTNANELAIRMAYELFEVGTRSDVIPLDNGNFMLFQIFLIDGPEEEELQEWFFESHPATVRQNHFMSELEFLREQANVVRNERALNRAFW